MHHDLGLIPPTLFGAGRLSEVADRAIALSARNVLVVADPFVAGSDMLTPLLDDLARQNIATQVFSDFAVEPKTAHVTEAARIAARCNLVIGIGGGSALDIAKSAAAIASLDADAEDYAVRGKALSPHRPCASIMVPTTAGTGSESSATNIMTDRNGAKRWIWGPQTKPDLIVLDPALTVSLPPELTAWTGMDALIHAFEAATNRHTHPGAQHHAHYALRLAAGALEHAVQKGDDLDARGAMMRASFHAGVAIDMCGTAIAHNISHAVAGFGPIHHGLATALAFEATLPWLVTNETAEIEAAAQALGTTTAELPGFVSAMMDACGIARSLPAAFLAPDPFALARDMRAPTNRPMLDATVGTPEVDELARAFLDGLVA